MVPLLPASLSQSPKLLRAKVAVMNGFGSGARTHTTGSLAVRSAVGSTMRTHGANNRSSLNGGSVATTSLTLTIGGGANAQVKERIIAKTYGIGKIAPGATGEEAA